MQAMDMSVGHFGDGRLQKGGPCCLARWLPIPAAASGGSLVAGRGRFSFTGFCGTLV